ncbi:MAG TPA: arginine--tRNA ligase [Methylomirabilota bacterium]|nr:arginine--tRNA ligase [Methylomirabilota bacterium]
MLREEIRELLEISAEKTGLQKDLVFDVSYCSEAKFGDYASNIALVGSKLLKKKPADLAQEIIHHLDQKMFEKVEVAGPGFINFTLKNDVLTKSIEKPSKPKSAKKQKILLEYFQPNIAKPLHIGHLRTAIIGDSIKRMLLYAGEKVESDTHMGDWGTQFGYLILAFKKYGSVDNEKYVQLNTEAETDKSIHEAAKQEFVKLEAGDKENQKIWQDLVNGSMKEFLKINDLMDILPFDHHWPESFYEDKMPAILEELKKKKLLVESQGAQIVNLENQGLGIAVIVKSDGGTTYLLRDLATFIFAQKEGFKKHLYVVDNRQSLHYQQLFAILALLKKIKDNEGVHINYGFISFKGQALSTRKGNMVLAQDVITQAEEKVGKIITEKNPDLKNKDQATKAITKAALKYFDLKHNRHSDIEFDWDEVLDFEGDSGPYLQYAYVRLSNILKKAGITKSELRNPKLITPTERELLFKLSILPEIVQDSLKDYLPNILAHYLYDLSGLINKFYHESPVVAEPDEQIRNFRLSLVEKAKQTLGQGLDLLGIEALEEM